MNQEIVNAIAAYLEKETIHIWHSQGEKMAFLKPTEYPEFSERKFCQEIAQEVAAKIEPLLPKGAGVNLYDPTVFPNQVPSEHFSEDVFVVDEHGMHGLAFYNFDTETWGFHTDTLVDYNEEGAKTKWKWYYPTATIHDQTPSSIR
jgi:hypothetical protein